MSDKQRAWTVPDDVRDQFATQQFTPIAQEDVERAYLEAGVIQHRIGGVVNAAPVRVEPAPGHWVTIGLMLRWESFAPGTSHSELAEHGASESLDEVEEPVAA